MQDVTLESRKYHLSCLHKYNKMVSKYNKHYIMKFLENRHLILNWPMQCPNLTLMRLVGASVILQEIILSKTEIITQILTSVSVHRIIYR